MAAPISWGGRAALLVAAIWLVACYVLMAHAPAFPWNGVVIAGPMLASLGALAWGRGWTIVAVAAFGVVGGLVWAALAGVVLPMPWLYIAQYTAVHLALAAAFAQTLGAGRRPLITRLAEPVHGDRFTAAMAVYTRRLTAAWAIYFAAMAAISLILYALAPFGWWALFANFVTPCAVALFFVAEHLLRYHWHPEFDRASIADAIGAWKRRSDGRAARPAA